MLSHQDASKATVHLRAKAEVAHANLGTLLGLILAAALAALSAPSGAWQAHVAIVAALVVLPWGLRLFWPKGLADLMVYRLSLVAFPINVLLLGFTTYLVSGYLPRVQSELFPAARFLFPALALALPLGYLLAQLPEWKMRLKTYPAVRDSFIWPPAPEAVEELEELLAPALAAAPGKHDAWAEFRTVRATPRNLKLFLKLDFEEHGHWRVAFSEDYALVVFHDGRRCEAVKRGGFSLAADRDSAPGVREKLCLIRWNEHFHEGRIALDDLLKVQSWTTRFQGLGDA